MRIADRFELVEKVLQSSSKYEHGRGNAKDKLQCMRHEIPILLGKNYGLERSDSSELLNKTSLVILVYYIIFVNILHKG